MEQFSWWYDTALDDAQVLSGVAKVFSDDFWMSTSECSQINSLQLRTKIVIIEFLPYRKHPCLTDPRVQATYIDIVDPLTRLAFVVEFDGIVPASKKGLPRMQWFWQIERLKERHHFEVCLKNSIFISM